MAISAPQYGQNGKSWYANVTKPMSTFITFTVSATDTGGLGVKSVMSNGYLNYLFMHTSATPGVVNGITNPNPASGYALISLKTGMNKFLAMNWQISPPAANTSTTSTTSGTVYSITALGTATLAQWQAVGFPLGFTPAVGSVFVATASQSIGGSATVGTPGVPTITSVNVLPDPNQMLIANPQSAYGGAQIALQFAATGSQTFTGSALAAHTHDLLLKDAAVVDGTTTRVNAGANLLGANTGSNITVTGGGANGGIVTASAGTPAGTVSAAALAATAPAANSIVRLHLIYDGSGTTIDGL